MFLEMARADADLVRVGLGGLFRGGMSPPQLQSTAV